MNLVQQIVSIDCAADKPKSDFTPANRDRQLDAYITAVENAIMTGQTRPDDFHSFLMT